MSTRIKDLPAKLQQKALINTFAQLRVFMAECPHYAPKKKAYTLKGLGNTTLLEAFVWGDSFEGSQFWIEAEERYQPIQP